jgi:crotonobetainyl-CoA:carnitine CoA-transferase CaiB-like acyl-CoA transferase
MLAALHARRRTGRGQWIDMALLEAVGPFFAQQFLEYTVTGEVPTPKGNAWGMGIQEVVPTLGKDCWLAVTLNDEGDIARIESVIGAQTGELQKLAADPPELWQRVAQWAATRDHDHAAAELQAAGIAAAPVMANWQIFTDNHLNDRGYFLRVRHPEAGTHMQPGFPWRFERTPLSIRLPAPLFAEHNAEVFHDLMGLSDAEVRALYEAGITSDAPIYATLGTL